MAGRIALTFSFAAAVFSCAFAGPYSDLERSLEAAKTPQQRANILRQSPLIQQDKAIQSALSHPSIDDLPSDAATKEERLEEAVEIKARAEAGPAAGDLRSVAADIESSPVYTNRGERESTNWLGRAIDRLRNLKFDMPKSKSQSLAPGIFGPWITYVAWIVLGAALIVFILVGLRHVNLQNIKRTRKRAGLLSQEEEDRSLDEWLVMADRLEKEGRYREAVRCLYLACLLKIDESRIARFDRGQTNWEHLARIESSPRRPEGLEFRKPTQAFDRIWYGSQVRGPEDVAAFRDWYREVVAATMRVAA